MTLPTVPTGIFQPTTPPEPARPAKAAPAAAEQGGGAASDEGPVEPAGGKVTRTRRRKATPTAGDKVEDMKLYLTEDVRFRLRMLAFKRNAKISTVANEVLDKALPRWTLERTE